MIPSLVLVCLTIAEPDLCLFDPPKTDENYPLPPIHDRYNFENQSVAKNQIELCQGWVDHCEMMQGIRGWSNGYWEDCIKRLEWQKRYWELVWMVHENFASVGSRSERLQLQYLKDYLGEDLYHRKYNPGILPDVPIIFYVPQMGMVGNE